MPPPVKLSALRRAAKAASRATEKAARCTAEFEALAAQQAYIPLRTLAEIARKQADVTADLVYEVENMFDWKDR